MSEHARRAMGCTAAVLLLCAGLTDVVSAADSTAQAVTPAWGWPLEPHPVVRAFVAPETAYSSGHRGIDIAGFEGQVVLAPVAGTVHFAGWVVDRPVVSIRHPGGLTSSFEPVVSSLAEGTPVTGGQVIGILERGHCALPCLHFGVRRYGEYVSPLVYLGGIPRSVLLPTRQLEAG